MDKKTLKALQGSIRKWEKIVEGTGEDKGVDNCPLCKIYWGRLWCRDCPVSKKTGEVGCNGSPYIDWDDHHSQVHNNPHANTKTICKKCLVLAKKELAFLKKLLPKEE